MQGLKGHYELNGEIIRTPQEVDGLSIMIVRERELILYKKKTNKSLEAY